MANFQVDLPHRCDLVTLSWEKVEAVVQERVSTVFPVHSYRVQRRLKSTFSPSALPIPLKSEKSNASDPPDSTSEPTTPAFSSNYALSTAYSTLYKGLDHEFTDSNLLPSAIYTYRIQAWNNIGNSAWQSFDYVTPARGKRGAGCDGALGREGKGGEGGDGMGGGKVEPTTFMDVVSSYLYNVTEGAIGGGTTTFKNLYLFAQLALGAVQTFFTVLALLAAGMRLKRGSTTSTGSTNLVPLFPWIWRGLNAIGKKLVGTDILPAAMLTDVDGLRRAASESDISYGAVGLAGNEGSKADGRR